MNNSCTLIIILTLIFLVVLKVQMRIRQCKNIRIKITNLDNDEDE